MSKSGEKINIVKVLIVIVIIVLLAAIILTVTRKTSNKSEVPSSTSKEEKVEKKSLEKIVEEFGGEIKDKPFDDVAVVEKAGETFTIYESGEILGGGLSVWTGESEEMTPDAEGNFHITNANQLKWMADKIINGEKNFGGITVFLETNIDLGARKDKDGNITGNKWTSMVGFLDELPKDEKAQNEVKEEIVQEPNTTYENLKGFLGIFEGNNKAICGVYVDSDRDYQGLFGYVTGIVQNLSVQNSFIKGNNSVGAIAGLNTGKIENCKVAFNEVTGVNKIGGAVGNTVSASTLSSVNSVECKIVGEDYVGGIVGYVNDNVDMNICKNSSSVEGKKFVGGISGITFFGCNVLSNTNTGNIKGQDSVGGIIGYSQATVEQSVNEGNIEGNDNSGGLIGINYSMANISRSYNKGNVTGKNNIGGIVGVNNATITSTYNRGDIEASLSKAGGVVGQNSKDSFVYSSYNTGKVTSKGSYAGIAGGNFGSITNSFYLDTCVEKVLDGTLDQRKSEEELKNIVDQIGEDYILDSENKNDGYPILNWQ